MVPYPATGHHDPVSSKSSAYQNKAKKKKKYNFCSTCHVVVVVRSATRTRLCVTPFRVSSSLDDDDVVVEDDIARDNLKRFFFVFVFVF